MNFLRTLTFKVELFVGTDIRDGRRILNFSPTDAAFGKNPGQLEPLEIPHPDKDPAFLAGVIAKIKDRLNAMTAEQSEAQAMLEGWRTVIDGLKDADDFNDKYAGIKTAPVAAQSLFSAKAKGLGITFNKTEGKFVGKVPEAA